MASPSKVLTIAAFAAVAFAAPLSLYAASTHRAGTPATAEVLPAYEILSRLRGLALDPISEPVLRGPYYVLHAYDRSGAEMRVVADAQFGDILSVVPVRDALPAYGFATVGGARIIHVPPQAADKAGVAPADDVPAAADGPSPLRPVPRIVRPAPAAPSPVPLPPASR